MKYLIICLVLLMTSCASNYIRVTEYEGSSPVVPGMQASAGGCVINQEGEVSGTITYDGEKCTYTNK